MNLKICQSATIHYQEGPKKGKSENALDIHQLKVENESLGNQIKSLTREKGTVAESHKAEIEALFTSINEGKSKLAESNDKSSGLQAQLDDTTAKLHQSEQRVVKLEESINNKSNEISELTSSNQVWLCAKDFLTFEIELHITLWKINSL